MQRRVRACDIGEFSTWITQRTCYRVINFDWCKLENNRRPSFLLYCVSVSRILTGQIFFSLPFDIGSGWWLSRINQCCRWMSHFSSMSYSHEMKTFKFEISRLCFLNSLQIVKFLEDFKFVTWIFDYFPLHFFLSLSWFHHTRLLKLDVVYVLKYIYIYLLVQIHRRWVARALLSRFVLRHSHIQSDENREREKKN